VLFDSVFDPPPGRHLHFGFAQAHWERRGYHALRRAIFCEEQKVFSGDDRDAHDAQAVPIIAVRNCMGMGDEVVGAVRIHEDEPGRWWGSRLCVDRAYRSETRFEAHGVFEDARTKARFSSVGAALIYKAVSTAHALGCERFLAHVQHQNVAFFKRLHWRSVEEIELHGLPHHEMEADLSQYPPSAFAHELEPCYERVAP
jgi:N-acyl-L-homoserine lactone synthetase